MLRGEKVKDIVEVRSFTHLYDFAADPALTTASYRFTDVTSDLLGKWIDRISDVKPGRGDALALAGLRGVGKSHFIAVLAALASRSDLRSQIGDVHVQLRTEKLAKRSLPVAFVRRGSASSLIVELKNALAEALSIDISELSDSLYDVLLRAYDASKGTTLSIFIDTEFGRNARVDRDDGAMLSEIAEAARNIGIFVGIALDDDVSGADGPNSSIARSYQIDFLDQEHLYKIVDRHIFPKNDAKLQVLKDIYSSYRTEIPGFKWSEQRFLPLYPMHPATLEISPLIRLFIHDFALLGFASDAGLKIMGRPADSLIGLDEMFGNVEPKLRKNPQLSTAFKDFDALDREVVQKSSVQFRLQAKLILKGLLLLSLDGQGASAATIAASMMVFDGQAPESGLEKVEKLLERFAAEFPSAVSRIEDETSTSIYCLRIGLDEGLDQAIAAIKFEVLGKDLWLTLLQQLAERFPEIQNEGETDEWLSQVTAEWRGALRRGAIIWYSPELNNHTEHSNSLDWEIRFAGSPVDDGHLDNQSNCIKWEVASLTQEETDTLVKLSLLRSHPELRQQFGESASATLHLLAASADKICQRIFFDEGFLDSDKLRLSMQCDLGSTHSLSHLFTTALKPVFEDRYPSHPIFLQSLGFKEVTKLVAGFFCREDIFDSHIQILAQCIAEPLGLAEVTPEGYVPASAEMITALPYVKNSLEEWEQTETQYMSPLSARFKTSPFGLTREAQQLILAAMVAQREIEFVTTTGNRINHRSLDLQIIWDDVVGISRPAGEKYSGTQLLSWAKELTGNNEINSLESNRDRIKVDELLRQWLLEWKRGKILENFEELPDECLNAASWRNAVAIRRSLGSVAEIIESYTTNGTVLLEDCVGSIADLFFDSESEFRKRKNDLQGLQRLTDRAQHLEKIYTYVTGAEITNSDEVEHKRRFLLNLLESESCGSSSDSGNLETVWESFQQHYKQCYLKVHGELFDSFDRAAVSRGIRASLELQRFDAYSFLSVFDRRVKTEIESMLREYRGASCNQDPSNHLDSSPNCSCGLSIKDLYRLIGIPDQIRSLSAEGVAKALLEIDDGRFAGPTYTPQDEVLLTSLATTGIHK